ncbi:MAG: M60 family metallopeptidase [Corallococcus sp.]|nr:M60 family metallopeptidase [Corallococcus sp.]MCM1360012.1 M60 family metallopeptidase [Corallococcus sp.]MCM1395569.1 M60 family metallopeptidase [Corallococcus sp.]
MHSKVRNFLLWFLSFVTAMFLVIAAALSLPAEKDSALANVVGGDMTLQKYAGSQFAGTQYKSIYEVASSEIKSYANNGGARDNYALDKMFDGNDKTFWISEKGNDETFQNYVSVNFVKSFPLKSIRYRSSYYSRDPVRYFSGYPTTLNVYVANGNDNFTLVGTCMSEPAKDFSEDVVFTLPETVDCDRIKLEFAEVSVYTGVFGGTKVAAAMDVAFYKSDDVIKPTVKASGNHGNVNYLVSNSVTAEEMKIRANGGGNVANAFDKNASTYWQSESYNTEIFQNKVTLTMEREQTIDSIVFGCSYYTRNGKRNFSGFPTLLNVVATREDGTERKFSFSGTPGNDWGYADFAFPEPLTCKKLVLEFAEVTVFSEIADGMPIVACSEMFLIKSADANIQETIDKVNGIFTDYAQYEIKEGYTIEKLNELRAEAKQSVSYEKSLKPILDRAEAIMTGAMKKDVYREFSTDPNAKNTIEQNGDLVDYCRNTLQQSSFGTNRQVIGIGGTTGETITIYVDAEDDDPLPSVAFTQIYGAWNSWMRTFTLHKGKNEIVFPNFKANGSYTKAIAAGGPIHIINPYTSDQQSSNVKVYIEGGYLYPVFHDGDDEGTFRVILTDFYERLTDPNDSSITVDAFEAVTGNAILSCTATLAYNSYVKGGSSPQFNLDKWRKYTVDTLAFGGVEFDENKPYYNEKNKFIKANYRIVQPYAGMYAFAYTEHIGIIDTATFGAMVQKWTLGWAFAHEFGHMLDNFRMKIPEVTNNMWAIFNIYMVDGAFNDRINVSNVSKNLASDFSAKVGKYYGNGNDNCDFWWIIEGAHPGYWANLQQLYCFETSGASVTDSTEKLCYFSSLATGVDMTEYFERWGFYFTSGKFNSGNRFSYEKTSAEFKEAMDSAKAEGRITADGKKFWYVNNDQYRYAKLNGGTLSDSWAACYDSSQTVEISDIMGSSGSYTLLLPSPRNAESHLCYEVQSYIDGKWQVLGVTYGTSYTDSYSYGEGVTPKYKVYAYDRMFNCTGDPREVSPVADEQTAVCRIGEVKYDSLKEAVAAAVAGDTIYLLKDLKDGGIVINKQLSIVPDPAVFTDGKAVTITKNAAGHLFNITANTFFGTQTNNNTVATSSPIILDGNDFAQNGSLIYVKSCTISLNNVTLQNNISTARGGGLYVDSLAAVYLNGCVIKNNSATDGGGIFLNGRSNIAIRGLALTGNVASSKGGGICELEYTGTSSFHNRDKVNGSYTQVVISDNRAANGGGIYTQNNVELYGASITDNTATANGGGVYTDIDNTSRYIQLVNCTVRNNTANLGDAVYMYRGKTSLNGGKIAGVIYKVYDTKASPPAVFELKSGLPDLSECEIRLSKSIPSDGLVLCESVTGMSAEIITDAAVSYKILNGHAQFEKGIGVKVYPNQALITVNYGSGSFETSVNWGSFTLPERFDELPEGKYIEQYTIDGKDYKVGQTISVVGNVAVVAGVKDYYKVKLVYNTYSETLLLRQNVVYYLPMKTPDGEVVFGWNCSNGNYYAYAEGVEISRDLEFSAVIKRLHSVVTVVQGVENSSQYEYGGSVTLPTPQVVFGKVFSHWEIEGKKYQANQTVKVTRDIVATAVYTDTWNVTTVIEDSENTVIYPNGAVINLNAVAPSLGRELKYWSVNGVKYYVGSTYTVTCDSEIVAVFAQINTENKITVTTVVNKGPIAGDDTVVENETEELSYSYNALHTFAKPKVNVGNEFLYWEVNGVKYAAGAQIAVTEPFTAIAVVAQISETEQPKNIVTVTVKSYVKGSLALFEYEYEINASICLTAPDDTPENKEFLHWLVNGEIVEAGTTVTFSEDTDVVAVYKDVEKPPVSDADGPKVGLIVGIVVGTVVAIGAGVAVALIVLKKRRSR